MFSSDLSRPTATHRLQPKRAPQARDFLMASVAMSETTAQVGNSPGLPLKPVRGQASFCPTDRVITASASGAYAVPAPGGVLFGATHDRDDVEVDDRPSDDARNRAALAQMRPGLAAALADSPAQGRASIRATTPDRMPIAGEIEPGLFVLTGLGSRGFTTAPLLAEHVAALVLGAPSPLPEPCAALVSPGRFRA